MRRLTDDTELQTLIAQGRGFLVKVTRGDLARVHPLEYLCYNARVQMGDASIPSLLRTAPAPTRLNLCYTLI